MRLLKQGGVLITFPSGEVSSLQLNQRKVTDPAWSTHIAALVRKTQANVLPIFFNGRNSSFFQLMGLVHPRLRTALLAHEMFKLRGSTLPVQVGNPISFRKLQKMPDEEMTHYLRVNTYFLKNRAVSAKKPSRIRFPKVKATPMEEIIPPVATNTLKAELAALPEGQKLVSEKEFEVYYGSARQIPGVLREIGRLREVTFREVNEGTGMSLDLDRFDETYTQLFLWNRKENQLVGAYRIGHLDTILESSGPKGLYTNTLFIFKPGFLEQLGKALELGRSFIRSEYQRKFGCLTLLWQGIGGYLAKHPQYHVLFGPVSISRDYHTVSKNLMVQFLKEHNRFQELAKLVKPRNPHRRKRINGVGREDLRKTLHSIDDVSALIAEIEQDGKSIPVLLRHYLKLNAQLLSFNVDKDFSDVLDGLVLVDLKTTDPRMTRRYMGDEAWEAYRRYHHIAG
ncbi:MAG: GNAT family N-acetyltransferase [Verrucomicrobiae bacterium]|nr:GNAT family N-acetyltransferase [Verrucomicrobiae bacterium]